MTSFLSHLHGTKRNRVVGLLSYPQKRMMSYSIVLINFPSLSHFVFLSSSTLQYLKMANSRIQLTNNKKSAAVKHKKREIATLLGEKKDEKARIKVEHVIREDFLIEAYELLELLCELVFERVKYIASCKECPPDLVEAVSSLIWAATRVEIAEMEQIKKQLVKKFGSKFASDAENNVGNCVNVRLFQKLSVQPPSAFLVGS
jgi:vacuolar protein sorting-associated protein IST1